MASRKLLSLAAVCAALVPGVVVASGCGAEDAAGVDVAKAASATGAKGTARVKMELRASGLGLPGTLDIEGEGVTALTEPRMDFTVDLASVAASFGIPATDAKVRVKLDKGMVYVDPPKVEGFELPDGATWASIDLRKAAESFGIDADGLGALFTVDPAAQLRALQEAADLKEVGEEEIDGAKTTHYRGQYTTEDMIAALPADKRAKAREAVKELAGLDKTLDDPIPADLWVDEDGIVRRMVSEATLPAEGGTPGGKMRITCELSDFGAELDTSAPPKDDTYEATEPLLQIFKQFGGGSLGVAPGGGSTTD